MAATVTDQRGILDEADATTGWTGSVTVELFTADPNPVELTGALAMGVSTATENAYIAITSDDWSGGGTLFVWMQANGTMDTQVLGGIQIVVGDGTNLIGYHVGGSDKAGFRHDVGPVRWTCFVLDLASKPTNSTAYAGSEASLDETAITQVGVAFKTLSKALGGASNCFWDIIRFADPGEGLTVTAGTSSVPGTLADVAAEDSSDTSQKAYGVLRKLGTGLYGCQSNLIIGDAATADSYFAEDGTTLAFEDRGLSTTNNYYRLTVVGGTGTNSFVFTNSTISVPSAASGKFDASDTDINTFDVSGSKISGFDVGVVTGGSTQVWTGVAFTGNGPITHNGADLTGSSVSGYEGTAGTAALTYDLAVDPDGELDDMTFEMGTALTHAIELGTNTPSSITLRGWDVSGYNASDAQNDSVIYNNSGKAITINLIGTTGTFSVRNGTSASTTVVINPVSLSVHVQDISTGTALVGARVYVLAATTGPLPFKDTVTITSATGTATVSHTAHGLSTGHWVKIEGAIQEDYNGAKQVTKIDADSYSYTVANSPTTPATGTITATAVIIFGTTDVDGDISDIRSYASDQDFTGRIRKSSDPYYKTSPLSGTIDSTNGLPLTVGLIPDE